MTAIALAVTRQDHPSDPAEQEIAALERDGDRLIVTLDDGMVLSFNADEIIAAAKPDASSSRVAA